MSERILVFVPTYNESENVRLLTEQIMALDLSLDLLFLDDHSPDGTGSILDDLAKQYPRLQVLHGSGKAGIGAAHQRGIRWAYEKGYQTLITMDADFTHSPSDIPNLLTASQGVSIVVGSRFFNSDSLSGWHFFRKFLTHCGHFLTVHLLRLPQDVSGAFRLYRLPEINPRLFDLVKPHGYGFFFYSLFILRKNGCRVQEIPIVLAPRSSGHSKMTVLDATRGLSALLILWLQNLISPSQFLLKNLSEPFEHQIE